MRRILTVAAAAVAFVLAGMTPALAVDDAANCLGEDRSIQGGLSSGEEFGDLLSDQLLYDVEVGSPGSTGASLAYAATTDCGG